MAERVTQARRPRRSGSSAREAGADAPGGEAGADGPPGAVAPRDRAGLRGAAFLLALVVALFLGYAIGRAAGPDAPPAADPAAVAAAGTGGHTHGTPGGDVGGFAVSENGYTLVADSTTFAAGVAAPLRFRILGPDRAPVTKYLVANEMPLHLVVVRRDLTGYQHLHPTMATDGTWSVPLTLPAPGVWRAFADFVVGDATGAQTVLTLGVDLTVAGAYTPAALPPAARESTVDGYTVSYEGTAQPGVAVPLLFRVFKSGQPAADLQPYLGAYGHLVVVREGDLGFLHVHPQARTADGAVRFFLTPPSPGRYRAFFDFQAAGAVRTAQYTVQVG